MVKTRPVFVPWSLPRSHHTVFQHHTREVQHCPRAGAAAFTVPGTAPRAFHPNLSIVTP